MAGTIDQLNFKVILDDKDFTTKVKQDIELANKLNISLSRLLDVKKQIGKFNQDDVTNNRKAQQILVDSARAQERITREKIKTEGVQKRINAQIERATKGYESQSRILNELKGYALGYLSIHGATQLLSSLVRVTGEFELQKTTLAAMLGDLNAAEGVITRIQGLAVESPFQFKELTTYAKQLSAFSVPAQELYDTTKMLADISAGLGVGMDRIVLAYGQVRSAAFLRGQEVRQFTEAGIPILNELAKQFSELEGRAVSTSEVFDKISKRLVPFEMVAQVFKDMTSEGGKFYNMQEVQAETLRGKISNLKDAYEVMLNEIGKGQSENLKGAVDWARRLMQNYEDTGKTLTELVAAYGIYKTALAAITLATGTFNLANHKLIGTFVSLGNWVANNPYALLAAGLAAIGYTIYKDVTALASYEKIQKSVADTQSKFTQSLASENAKLDILYAKLKFAKEGTKEYQEAKKDIYTQYASYISVLEQEGVAVNNLADIYDNLKSKIEESQKERFRGIASQNIERVYAEETSAMLEEAEKATNSLLKKTVFQLNETEKKAVQAYVSGILSIEDIRSDKSLSRVGTLLTEAADSGNREWQQFGTSIEHARLQFQKSTIAYKEGIKAIEDVYGKAQDITASGENPFVYNLTENPKGKSPAQKAIEEQIKSVQKLQDAYEKLMPYLNEVQMKSTLKSLFPNISEGVIDSLDFRAELERLADELAKFDEDAAQRLKDTVGKDVAGTIADSFKAVEQYKKMLDSWLGEDFNLSGKGINFDISKIISNLNTEYAKIDQKRKKALDLLNKAQMGDEAALAKVREIYGEEVWQKYLVNGKQVIEKLAEAERASAKETAEERIRDLAQKYVKEKMFEQNIDLSDFEDKNINQVRTLLGKLKDLATETQGEIDKLNVDGLTEEEKLKLEGFIAALDILQNKIGDTSEELDKKIVDKIASMSEEISGSFAKIGSEISSLGDEIGNEFLSDLGTRMSEFGDFAKELSSGIKDFAEEVKDIDFENTSFKDLSEGAKGGVIGIVATVITAFYGKIKNMILSSYEAQRKLTEATREYEETLLDIRREQYTNIFGTDEMALAAENMKILNEATEQYKKDVEAANKVKFQGFRAEGGFGREGLKKQSVIDMLGTIAEGQGWELYKEDGELNIDAIESYYDSFSDRLTEKQRQLVENLIASGNAMNDAAKQSIDYMSSLFNGVADDIASTMVEAFIKTGDAATDLSDIVSNIAKEMAKDLIETLYIMPILEELEKTYQDIDARTDLSEEQKAEQKISALESALGRIQGKAGQMNNTLGRIERFFGEDEDSATETLADGIKGLTEDTANLLASYLNAIRSDVSQMRVIQALHLPIISQSMPTITEHLAKIQANTYNTAVNTAAMSAKLEDIRSTLDSVMTSDGGASAFRTYGV